MYFRQTRQQEAAKLEEQLRARRAELEQYEPFFCKLSGRLSLQYDLTVSIVLSDTETFARFKTALPFYRNIEREGIKIA